MIVSQSMSRTLLPNKRKHPERSQRRLEHFAGHVGHEQAKASRIQAEIPVEAQGLVLRKDEAKL